jgi:subtilisin family serine protease
MYHPTLAMLSLHLLAVLSSSAILGEETTLATASSERFIVALNSDYSHEHFEHFMTNLKLPTHDTTSVKPSMMEVHHRYSKAFHGLAVSGVTEEEIRKHPGVKTVQNDRLIFLEPSNATPSFGSVDTWGLDRINQLDLPLDDYYYPSYQGVNVDIYIIDSGIDTTHEEFAANPSDRVVQNIWAAPDYFLSDNNDQMGHGTAVASNAGGNSVGVSPYANVYGLRVFGATGGAWNTDTIAAIDYVIDLSARTGRRSVINLSLGSKFHLFICYYRNIISIVGKCAPDCAQDSTSIAALSAVEQGIVVVVAAGNEGENSCDYSPASGSYFF